MSLFDENTPLTLRALIIGRILMSGSATLFPRLALKAFGVTPTGVDSAAFRMFGIRNAILAFYLSRQQRIEDTSTFLLLNVVADTVDAAAILDSYRRGEGSAVTAARGVTIAGLAAASGALARHTLNAQKTS